MQQLGFTVNGTPYDMTTDQSFSFPQTQTISMGEEICGLSLFVQEFYEFASSIEPTEYIMWRLVTCDNFP